MYVYVHIHIYIYVYIYINIYIYLWTHSTLFACMQCGPGEHREISTATGLDSCVWCESAKYKPDSSTSLACTNCPFGKTSGALRAPKAHIYIYIAHIYIYIGTRGFQPIQRQPIQRQRATNVSVCRCIGWMGTEGVCTGCVAGKYRSNLVSDACADCSAGKFSEIVNARTDTCADCGAGTYAADDKSMCLQCPADHLKSSAGPEGCWGTLQSVNVAQRCVVSGVTGPCEIFVRSERSG